MTNIPSPYLQNWDKRKGKKTAAELKELIFAELMKHPTLNGVTVTLIDKGTYDLEIFIRNANPEQQTQVLKIFREVLIKEGWTPK